MHTAHRLNKRQFTISPKAPSMNHLIFVRFLLPILLLGVPLAPVPVLSAQTQDPDDYLKYGIYAATAPRAETTQPRSTKLPLDPQPGQRIMLVGNTLLERAQYFGHFEALIQSSFPNHQLEVRNLAWSADTADLQPRPANFADLEQHLTHEQADIIFLAYGFNESFAGEQGMEPFRKALTDRIRRLTTRAFNGVSGPAVVLVSPIANENTGSVAAADMNNANIGLYTQAMREIAKAENIGFIDVFQETLTLMADPQEDLTINGIHLNEQGYLLFSQLLFQAAFQRPLPEISHPLREVILDKNRHFFRRYRPLNTFYYTGDRNKTYGYLDFLPAMESFDVRVSNRDQRIWEIAQGQSASTRIIDSNIPELPMVSQSRGANRWMTAQDERRSFEVDPRFEVTLFAGEEEFPDLAAPIQMRWDNQGRLWVSCSTTYPHVYPGNEPNDKLIILEDTDQDGKADRSTVFADDLHIPLSFEFGDGGVYVSEMPHLTFLKDTDGDGKADYREQVLTGFGTEDSHHALHDFTWTPDGDLIFRESVFHHSQVETPYGPVRQHDSGWFRFEPRDQRLTSFGTYFSTNPWGVTFDDWGQHVASHPIYAAAFHSLDPEYPKLHPKPEGLQAYSGTCGQEFVDFATFPSELRGGYIKARYKPTNRIEIHQWTETEFGYEEKYISDIIFSKNLSFIPVDIRFGPRGALYVCDWYNPIKGHMQYALRDDRRDRHSGRIWRITTKGLPLQDPPPIAEAGLAELFENLKRPEYRYRYWTKRELRERDPEAVKQELQAWTSSLDPRDSRYRHHQLEALWVSRWLDQPNLELIRELVACDDHHARAAAVQQLRWCHADMADTNVLLKQAANDPSSIVRMEAAIAASYVGTPEALEAILDLFNHPLGGHLTYALTCALNSKTLRPLWETRPELNVSRRLAVLDKQRQLVEPKPNAQQKEFDRQKGLQSVNISCIPEKMLFTLSDFTVQPGAPVKLVFTNPDATDHNLVIVKPGALEEVGMAANEMAKDPRFAESNFIPQDKKHLILQNTPMIGPNRKKQVHVLRFIAPEKPGVYPFVCTFPGHWVVMQGQMVVAANTEESQKLLDEYRAVNFVKLWTIDDFETVNVKRDETTVMRGMKAFIKAQCLQCHEAGGHGVALGPDLSKVSERFKGKKLLAQLLEPSQEINPEFQTYQFVLDDASLVTGVIVDETETEYRVVTNPLKPDATTRIPKNVIEEKLPSKVSAMPEGLLNVLTQQEILDLIGFLESGGLQLPDHLEHHH
jgi:putative heme-binding domain-containing protein